MDGTFYGAPVDWQNEMDEAMRLMGLRSTDIVQLHKSFALLYLRCPAEWEEKYARVLDMISTRMLMRARFEPDLDLR